MLIRRTQPLPSSESCWPGSTSLTSADVFITTGIDVIHLLPIFNQYGTGYYQPEMSYFFPLLLLLFFSLNMEMNELWWSNELRGKI